MHLSATKYKPWPSCKMAVGLKAELELKPKGQQNVRNWKSLEVLIKGKQPNITISER